MSRFFISVLCLNRLEQTKACVASILAGGGDWILQITNNASADGTASYMCEIAAAHPGRILYVNNAENKGFIGGNNDAFETARKLKAKYFCAVNNDAEVPRGWLDRFDDVFRRNPACALSGAKGGCCTLLANGHGSGGSEFDYAEGTCLCVDIEKVSRHYTKLFSEYLTMAYFEDSDLSLRMRRLGYTAVPANFEVVHNRASTSKTLPWIAGVIEKNKNVFLSKWGHWLTNRSFRTKIIVRRTYAIGDVLMITPIIRGLFEQRPQAEIYVETNYPELFKDNPCVMGAVRKMPPCGSDMLIDLNMVSENSPLRHFIDSYWRAAGLDGDPIRKCELYFEPFACTFPDAKWAALHLDTTTWSAKNWPLPYWQLVADELRLLGYKILLVGKHDSPASVECDLDLRNKTDIPQLASALSQCDLFVGHDSFPSHVAMTVECPTVVIYGVTESKYIMHGDGVRIGCDADQMLYPDAGARHRTGGLTEFKEDGTTIRSITVARVMDAVREVTTGKPARRVVA